MWSEMMCERRSMCDRFSRARYNHTHFFRSLYIVSITFQIINDAKARCLKKRIPQGPKNCFAIETAVGSAWFLICLKSHHNAWLDCSPASTCAGLPVIAAQLTEQIQPRNVNKSFVFHHQPQFRCHNIEFDCNLALRRHVQFNLMASKITCFHYQRPWGCWPPRVAARWPKKFPQFLSTDRCNLASQCAINFNVPWWC